MRVRYAIAGVLAAGALASGSVTLLAPVARADANDAAYVIQLLDQGLKFSSADYVIGLGHAICVDLENGTPPLVEANILPRVEALGGWQLSLFDARFLVGTAQKFYCPDTRGLAA